MCGESCDTNAGTRDIVPHARLRRREGSDDAHEDIISVVALRGISLWVQAKLQASRSLQLKPCMCLLKDWQGGAGQNVFPLRHQEQSGDRARRWSGGPCQEKARDKQEWLRNWLQRRNRRRKRGSSSECKLQFRYMFRRTYATHSRLVLIAALIAQHRPGRAPWRIA